MTKLTAKAAEARWAKRSLRAMRHLRENERDTAENRAAILSAADRGLAAELEMLRLMAARPTPLFHTGDVVDAGIVIREVDSFPTG